ncbi:hypothetical protein [Rhizobium nepotum]|uniref:hypothetical protein n=1 Tax=Rhizobium nepotum TaxID=1035271 RepID=UPI003CF9EE76
MSLTVGPFQFGVVSAFCAGNAAKTGSEYLPAPHRDIVKTSLSSFTNRRFRQSRSGKPSAAGDPPAAGNHSETGKPSPVNDYNIGAKIKMAFASRNTFFKRRACLQHPAGGSRIASGSLRRRVVFAI